MSLLTYCHNRSPHCKKLCAESYGDTWMELKIHLQMKYAQDTNILMNLFWAKCHPNHHYLHSWFMRFIWWLHYYCELLHWYCHSIDREERDKLQNQLSCQIWWSLAHSLASISTTTEGGDTCPMEEKFLTLTELSRKFYYCCGQDRTSAICYLWEQSPNLNTLAHLIRLYDRMIHRNYVTGDDVTGKCH